MKKLYVLLALILAFPAAAVELGDDGLHKTHWFIDTFKDLQEDSTDAAAEGKRLVIFVEQRGCIYCTKMHKEVFPDPRIEALLENDYYPIQIDLHGASEIIDTDGEELSQRAAARKWGLLFTPSIIFLPPEVDFTKSAVEQAVAVLPGAFARGTTLDMFTWVKEDRYLDQSEEDFQRYHARMIRTRNDGNTD